jgi:putative solute:sodium symporter small subunit
MLRNNIIESVCLHIRRLMGGGRVAPWLPGINRACLLEVTGLPSGREDKLMATPDRVSYWNDTRRLMFIMLALWVFFGFVVHFFVGALNNIVILGFPLGYYMAAQGSLIAFVVMLFWFARKQNAIDEKHGVAEE